MKALTRYEAEQVRKIAGWKAEPPSYVSGMLEKLTHPLVKLAEKALPPKMVVETINDAYASSEVSSHRETVLEKAKVSALHELWKADLTKCDKLADAVAYLAEEKAMLKGAGSGGGNLLSAVIVVKSLLTYCLQTIHTIGYCYGFGTEEPHEREYVLGIMLVASASNLEEKQHSVASIGNVADSIMEEAFDEMIQDAVTEKIIEAGGLHTIPAIGILAGAMQFATMTQHVARIAKFTFQERWLRVNGKIDGRVKPDTHQARPWVQRVAHRTADSVYWTTFAVGFLASAPTLWAYRSLVSQSALGHGLEDGGSAALKEVQHLVATIKAPRSNIENVMTEVPALA
ncbi:MAG: EcsC family protein [Planctomycetaceae bacterium]|nr:EcsC family protein [Planctomycetaceae bacterium]